MSCEREEQLEDRLGLVGHCIAEKYEVEAVIGDGGFSVVYRALHRVWREPVAIKCFVALSNAPGERREALLEAFIREGKLMSQLSGMSASVAQARDTGSINLPDQTWVPYLVLEWLEGSTLATVLDRECSRGQAPRSLGDCLVVMRGPAQALALAHEMGVAHMDVKPDNFFVCAPHLREGVRVKVLDFGVSRVFDQSALRVDDPKHLPISTMTPDYAAPELHDKNYGAPGPQTDIFGFALVLVEMMRGGMPALLDDAGFSIEAIAAIKERCVDPLRRPTPRFFGLSVSDATEAVFRRALAVRADERYPNMGEFFAALCQAEGLLHLQLGEEFNSGTYEALAADSAAQHETFEDEAQRSSSVLVGAEESAVLRRVRSRRRWRSGAILGGLVLVVGSLGMTSGFWRDLGVSKWNSLGPKLGVKGTEDHRSSNQAVDRIPAPGEEAPPPAEATSRAHRLAGQKLCPEGMALVPGGMFFMGSDSDSRVLASARPAHQVQLQPYCLHRYEVSMEEYRRCSTQGKCKRAFRISRWPRAGSNKREWIEAQKAYSVLCNENYEDRGEHPVNCVTWSQALAYCETLGYRLPRESEWEFAARGSDGRLFPWGDASPDVTRANVCGNECTRWRSSAGLEPRSAAFDADDRYPGTSPRGEFAAGQGQWGHHDLVGNLFEWTADRYLPYPNAPRAESGFSSKKRPKRVIRGGAFNSYNTNFSEPALRYGMPEGTHSHGIGFRCAAEPRVALKVEEARAWLALPRRAERNTPTGPSVGAPVRAPVRASGE